MPNLLIWQKACVTLKLSAVISYLRCSVCSGPLKGSPPLWLGQPEKHLAVVDLTVHCPSFCQGVWAFESTRSGDWFGLDSLRRGNHVRGGKPDGWRRPVNSDRPTGERHEGVCTPCYQLAPQQRQEIPSDQWWVARPAVRAGVGGDVLKAVGKGEPWDHGPSGVPQFWNRDKGER